MNGRPRGVSIAILGPDGVGKSSLVGAVQRELPQRVTVLKVSTAAPVSRGPRPMRWLVGLLRTARALVASRVAVGRGRVVIWDRHPFEDRYTAQEGRRVLGRGKRWLARLAAPPDLVVVLDAPTETLHRRRSEHTREELDALRGVYRRLAAESDAVVLDASKAPDRLVDEVVEELRTFDVRRARRAS